MFCCNSWCLPESCSNLFFFGSNYILFVVLVNTLVLTKILKSEIFKNHIIKWKGKECIKARSISAPLWMWCQSITSFSSDFSDNCRQKKNSTEFLLKLLDLKSDFTLTLGYLNPSLNTPPPPRYIEALWELNVSPKNTTQWPSQSQTQTSLTSVQLINNQATPSPTKIILAGLDY